MHAADMDANSCLVAGGMGERLGYNGIKIELPTILAQATGDLKSFVAAAAASSVLRASGFRGS